ncbi:NAD(P)H-hydrate dehydratase [Parendozoicomonas haliclonae]|uniref:Bifunctional NAD(P)H-hydrate repair enzyme n=1 Tax=Parendozoicomonas haliclonae TaxID=1960125 RepID=A0A1X7ARL2_9GAMM|nr:NAD(P)H-hydrate dehydratase [Parendozoicomonas haliclonae]SMA50875.1 Bifunctional NAD(P)H-hydrate repair enzyme Nnr [Parendozoicomonas haliclonae]
MGGSLPHSLYTAEQTRNLDAEAIQVHGISGIELMKRAGQAAFEAVLKQWPQIARGGTLQIFCGAGNNGGDGYIIAALARQRYIPVRVVTLKDPDQLTGDARKAWEWYRSLSGRTQPWSELISITGDLVIDAMLGTGLTGEVSGDYASAIDAINTSGKPVIAIDIPSGLSADSGMALGRSIQADLTVTFIGMKRGLVTGTGPQVCGQIIFSDLQVPAAVYETVPATAKLIKKRELTGLIHPRARDAHKGHYGHLLIVGGDHGMGGAAIMAAEAAMRSGAGLVTLATRPEHVMASMVRRPEVMARAVATGIDLEALLKGKTAVVIGPGLGKEAWGAELLKVVLSSDLPVLLDADALNLLAETPELLQARENCVITPHPGEASRMLGVTIPEIAADRFGSVEQLQALCGGAAVLKGAGSLVAVPENGHVCTYICRAGNPGMAVAGMGDVLSGVIGALLAQGLSAAEAARLGVWLHASAGDECAKAEGEAGMAATDLIPAVRRLINGLMAEEN